MPTDNVLDQLRADMLAFEQVLCGVLAELCRADANATPVIMKGFDVAANVCERLSIEFGERARHFTLALERVEDLRVAVKGKDEKRHGV